MDKNTSHWLRFRLRTLFFLLNALAILLGSAAVNRQRAAEQQLALFTISEADIAGVLWGYEWLKHPEAYPNWAPAWLRKSLGDDFFGDVVAINFDKCSVPSPNNAATWSDSQFELVCTTVKKLPRLEVVGFGENTASDLQVKLFEQSFPNVRIIRGGFGPNIERSPF